MDYTVRKTKLSKKTFSESCIDTNYNISQVIRTGRIKIPHAVASVRTDWSHLSQWAYIFNQIETSSRNPLIIRSAAKCDHLFGWINMFFLCMFSTRREVGTSSLWGYIYLFNKVHNSMNYHHIIWNFCLSSTLAQQSTTLLPSSACSAALEVAVRANHSWWAVGVLLHCDTV